MLKPYEYHFIKAAALRCVNVYHTVNDRTTQELIYNQMACELLALDSSKELSEFVLQLKDKSLTRKKVELLIEPLKNTIALFPDFSTQHIKNQFKKVKKITIPKCDETRRDELTYFAWNDLSSSRKYVINSNGEGYYGTMFEQVKSICTICEKTSVVTLFLATTKKKKDGNYTKNGTYICVDSDQCNRQIQSLRGFEKFESIVKPRK